MNTEVTKRNKLIHILLSHSARYAKLSEDQLALMESKLHTYTTSKLVNLRKKANKSFYKLLRKPR